MAQEEAEHTYASRVNAPMTKADEEALFDAFQIGNKYANAGLKNTSYQSVESILTEMAYKGALNEVFDKKIGR